jgi:hypothetical protein
MQLSETVVIKYSNPEVLPKLVPKHTAFPDIETVLTVRLKQGQV